jgi:Uma2 family endonuclease
MSEPVVKLMNSEELFALPDDDMERWLIKGELRERPTTKRNPGHSGATAALSRLIGIWLMQQPKPRGKVYDGEAYFRIRRNPDTNRGIDVAYASAELVARTPKGAKFLDGPPVLAAEVLSPHDQIDDVEDSVEEYLEAGVKLVWVVNPRRETVTVYRPDQLPELVNVQGELSGDPHMPGLRFCAAEIFAD